VGTRRDLCSVGANPSARLFLGVPRPSYVFSALVSPGNSKSSCPVIQTAHQRDAAWSAFRNLPFSILGHRAKNPAVTRAAGKSHTRSRSVSALLPPFCRLVFLQPPSDQEDMAEACRSRRQIARDAGKINSGPIRVQKLVAISSLGFRWRVVSAVPYQCGPAKCRAVTAEAAGSSPVVPAIHSKRVVAISLKPTRVQKGAFLHPFCTHFRQLESLSHAEL
jgi:hypothetical protein